MTDRLKILRQIDVLSESNCRGCKKRAELFEKYRHNNAQIESYCVRECSVGKELQELGKQLHSPEKRLSKIGEQIKQNTERAIREREI